VRLPWILADEHSDLGLLEVAGRVTAGAPEQIAMQDVGPNLFSLLGVNAMMGRVFVPSQDGVEGADKVALLSFELWQRRYGADPDILGRKILVDDTPRTVIGVMPRGFQFFVKQQSFYPKPPEMWVPMILSGRRYFSWPLSAGRRFAAAGNNARRRRAMTSLPSVSRLKIPHP
jgi:hypothetical protein